MKSRRSREHSSARILGVRQARASGFACSWRSHRTAVALPIVALALLGVSAQPALAGQSTSTVRTHTFGHHEFTPSVLDVAADNTPDGSGDFYILNTHRLRAGLVEIRLVNIGTVAHQVQLIRLHDGITPGKYRADLIASHGGTVVTEGDATGGATAVDPGGHQVTWINLRPGTYVALCFQTGGDAGAPHFVHGMFDSFTVVGHHPRYRSLRDVRGTIRAFSFGFHLPKVIDGHATYRFVNTAVTDTHELQLLRLLPGKTAGDVVAWVKSGQTTPPPVSASTGGAGAIAPGGQEWLRMNLPPGNYVAVCFVPDDQPPHAPHAALGMVAGFTVTG